MFSAIHSCDQYVLQMGPLALLLVAAVTIHCMHLLVQCSNILCQR